MRIIIYESREHSQRHGYLNPEGEERGKSAVSIFEMSRVGSLARRMKIWINVATKRKFAAANDTLRVTNRTETPLIDNSTSVRNVSTRQSSWF